MKAKILNYNPQDGQGTVAAEDNKTYAFSTAQWREQSPPNVGEEVEIKTDTLGNISEISYGLLHKNYASTVPQSNPVIEDNVSSDWAVEESYTIIDWFKKCLRNYANFNGRARRKEYWYYTLVVGIFIFIAAIVDAMLGFDDILMGLVSLIFIIPSIAVAVRRLHDVNKSGWWYLISIIPIIGSIVLLIWMVTDTYPNTNQWGKPARNVR